MSLKMKTIEECPNRIERWSYNRKALAHDVEALQAMMEVREERLSTLHQQDLNCLRKMHQK